MDYTKKMETELNGLTIENYDYFKKMVSYTSYRGYFCDGEALSENLYNMVCDLKAAEQEGLTAEEFFGKDPQSMMDQVIAETPRRKPREHLKLFLVVIGIFFQMRLTLPFIWEGAVRFTPVIYLLDWVSTSFYLAFIYIVWGRTVYQKFSKNLAAILSVVAYFAGSSINHHVVATYGNLGSIAMPNWLVLSLIVGIGLGIMLLGYKGLEGKMVFVMTSSFILGALVRIFFEGIVDHMTMSFIPILGFGGMFVVYWHEKRRKN